MQWEKEKNLSVRSFSGTKEPDLIGLPTNHMRRLANRKAFRYQQQSNININTWVYPQVC